MFLLFHSISAESSLVCCWPDYTRAICSQWHRAEHGCIEDSVNHRVHDRLGADSIVADADCGTPGTTAYHQRQQIECAQMQRRERGRGRETEKRQRQRQEERQRERLRLGSRTHATQSSAACRRTNCCPSHGRASYGRPRSTRQCREPTSSSRPQAP